MGINRDISRGVTTRQTEGPGFCNPPPYVLEHIPTPHDLRRRVADRLADRLHDPAAEAANADGCWPPRHAPPETPQE